MQKIEKLENLIELKIRQIEVGDRCRINMGDIENLALSIEVNGLIYPIVVSLGEGGKYNLIEGERRIRAAKSLGWTKIDCILLASLPGVRRKELEIIMCVQRKQLSFVEEARAVRDLVNQRRAEAQKGGLARFSTSIRNKDVAMELNMHESRLSECLKIAEAVDNHPELEVECTKRTECIRRIRKKDFYVPDGGFLQGQYEESFIYSSKENCMKGIEGKIIDLCILHLDEIDKPFLADVVTKMKLAGQIIIFGETRQLIEWEEELKKLGLNVNPRHFMWVIKEDDDYISYLWAGKNRKTPLRTLPPTISCSRPTKRLSPKAKPQYLISQIVKCCTDRHAFVVVPFCEDIETVRCCVDINRNIRAACPDKMLKEKLILSVTEDI